MVDQQYRYSSGKIKESKMPTDYRKHINEVARARRMLPSEVILEVLSLYRGRFKLPWQNHAAFVDKVISDGSCKRVLQFFIALKEYLLDDRTEIKANGEFAAGMSYLLSHFGYGFIEKKARDKLNYHSVPGLKVKSYYPNERVRFSVEISKHI